MLQRLEAAYGPAAPAGRGDGAGPGRYVTFAGFAGRVGFISAMTHQFCGDCNRVRLTATGFLKTCLQYEQGADLKAPDGGGGGRPDAAGGDGAGHSGKARLPPFFRGTQPRGRG